MTYLWRSHTGVHFIHLYIQGSLLKVFIAIICFAVGVYTHNYQKVVGLLTGTIQNRAMRTVYVSK